MSYFVLSVVRRAHRSFNFARKRLVLHFFNARLGVCFKHPILSLEEDNDE
jgi:hypothetical protein